MQQVSDLIPERQESKLDFILRTTVLVSEARSVGLTDDQFAMLTRNIQVIHAVVMHSKVISRHHRQRYYEFMVGWRNFAEGVELARQQGVEIYRVPEDMLKTLGYLVDTFQKLAPNVPDSMFRKQIDFVNSIVMDAIHQESEEE